MSHSKYQFLSLAALGQHLKSLGNSRVEYAGTASETGFNVFECNGFDYQRALDVVAAGGSWEQGAQKLAEVQFNHAQQYNQLMRSFETTVTGFYPIVPHAVMGLPNAMLNTRKTVKPVKQIKIAVHTTISHNVTPAQANNRGRAILAAVETLQKLGYSVELWGISKSGETKVNRSILVETLVKPMNASANLAATATAFCSAFFTRRILCRLIESDPENAVYLSQTNYGYPLDLDAAELLKYDSYFPALNPAHSAWSTPESALEYVTKHIENSLKKAA